MSLNIYGLVMTVSYFLFVHFMHLTFVFYVPELDHIVGQNVSHCVYKHILINLYAFVGIITVYI
jgi:hypothetical protein